MTEQEESMYRQLARITGEPVTTLVSIGFQLREPMAAFIDSIAGRRASDYDNLETGAFHAGRSAGPCADAGDSGPGRDCALAVFRRT